MHERNNVVRTKRYSFQKLQLAGIGMILDGSIEFSISGSTSVYKVNNFSMVMDGKGVVMNGKIEENKATGTSVFDVNVKDLEKGDSHLSGSIVAKKGSIVFDVKATMGNGSVIKIRGPLSINKQIVTGKIELSLDKKESSFSLTCDFKDFNLDTAPDDEYYRACGLLWSDS